MDRKPTISPSSTGTGFGEHAAQHDQNFPAIHEQMLQYYNQIEDFDRKRKAVKSQYRL
jgi:hypothetical protein